MISTQRSTDPLKNNQNVPLTGSVLRQMEPPDISLDSPVEVMSQDFSPPAPRRQPKPELNQNFRLRTDVPLPAQSVQSVEKAKEALLPHKQQLLETLGLSHPADESSDLQRELESMDIFLPSGKPSASDEVDLEFWNSTRNNERLLVADRLRTFRSLCIIMQTVLTLVHLSRIFVAESLSPHQATEVAITYGVFFILDLVALGVALLSFFRRLCLLRYIVICFLYFNVMLLEIQFDFFALNKNFDDKEEVSNITLICMTLAINSFLFFMIFRNNKTQYLIGLFFLVLNFSSFAFALSKDAEGKILFKDLQTAFRVIMRNLIYYFFCMSGFISMNNAAIKHIRSGQDQQKEFRVIFHSIEESLLIFEADSIQFANNHFLRHFEGPLLKIAGDKKEFMTSKILREFHSAKKPFDSDHKSHNDLKSTQPPRSQEEVVEFSVKDLLSLPVNYFEGKRFELLSSAAAEGGEKSTKSMVRKYVAVKRTPYSLEGQDKVILQFKDITNDILQDQYKNENQLLEMINACVSHELRNPLNSISAQNIEKESIYEKIESLTKETRCFPKMKPLLEALRNGQRVQNSSIEIMTFIVQDLLDYAQIKAGKFRKNIERFNVIEAVQQVVSIQKRKAENQGIALRTDFSAFSNSGAPGSSPFVITDRQRVMQVLLGLQSNALKFTQKGSVTIRAKVLTLGEGRFLEIAVIDTGIGIAYEDQDKLFKLFGFLNSSKQLNTQGIGLGLVISDQIVTQFKGQISFSSIPGHGSTFRFTFQLDSEQQDSDARQADRLFVNSSHLEFRWVPPLNTKPQKPLKLKLSHRRISVQYVIENLPLTKSTEDLLSSQRLSPKKRVFQTELKQKEVELSFTSQADGGDFKILLVDDQIYNLEALEIILKHKVGIDTPTVCEKAITGQQALDMVERNILKNKGRRCDYRLILMDCNMPHMDGYEATDHIRRLIFERGLPQPIISAVTGHSEQMYVEKAIKSGMNQVLTKPVKGEVLKTLVSRLGF